MKFIQLSKNTYVRIYDDIGYITNQLTKNDRVYDEIGAIFLKELSRFPQDINDIVNNVYPIFSDITKEELKSELKEFYLELFQNSFVLFGENINNLQEQETSFSYSTLNPRKREFNFLKQDKNPTLNDTSDFFYSYFKNKPVIFGMHMEITARCNEKCIHCYLPRNNRNYEMDYNLAKNILDQLSNLGTLSITFSGGEPFLNKDFMRMLQYAREKDFIINILTNGYLINDSHIKLLNKLNISMIQVSLYSMDYKIHDKITQLPGSQKRTIQSIEKLIANDIPVQISCPAMKVNKDSYRDVALWGKKNNIRVLSDFVLMAKTDFDTSNLEQRLNVTEASALIKEIIEVEDEYQALLELDPKSKDLHKYAQQPVCGVGVDNACVTADGSIYPCSGFQGYTLGNVKKKTIEDIWKNSEKLKFLRNITNASFPECLKCEARDYCAMCLVRNFNESNGDVFKIQKHYCDIAFLNKKLVEEAFKK